MKGKKKETNGEVIGEDEEKIDDASGGDDAGRLGVE